MDNVIKLKPKWELSHLSEVYFDFTLQLRHYLNHGVKPNSWFDMAFDQLTKKEQEKIQSDTDTFTFLKRQSWLLHGIYHRTPRGKSTPLKLMIAQKSNIEKDTSPYPIPSFGFTNGAPSENSTFKLIYRQHKYPGNVDDIKLDKMRLKSINSNFTFKVKRIKDSVRLKDLNTLTLQDILDRVLRSLEIKFGTCQLHLKDGYYLIEGCYFLKNEEDHHKYIQVSIEIDSNLYSVLEPY